MANKKHKYALNGDNVTCGAFFIITNVLKESGILPFPEELTENMVGLCEAIKEKEETTVEGIGELKKIFTGLNDHGAADLRKDLVHMEQILASRMLARAEDENGETDSYCGDEG